MTHKNAQTAIQSSGASGDYIFRVAPDRFIHILCIYGWFLRTLLGRPRFIFDGHICYMK
jgi:hypothetical protein